MADHLDGLCALCNDELVGFCVDNLFDSFEKFRLLLCVCMYDKDRFLDSYSMLKKKVGKTMSSFVTRDIVADQKGMDTHCCLMDCMAV